jgi:hypothetical protein
MLHNALENDFDGVEENFLKIAADFVHQFPDSLEIIVTCARKSEMSLWAHFFSIIGDPKILYQVFSILNQ